MLKIDFHIHTKYSPDSFISFFSLKKKCEKLGITPIISDHNTIKGNKRYGCKIVAEEISTSKGDIIGLFLNEKIKPYLSPEETVDKILEQDGLVYLPHGFDRIRSRNIMKHKFKVDIVEVFNPRTVFEKDNLKADIFARYNGLLKAVGSDSHFLSEIGKTYTLVEDFDSKKEFLKNMKKAKFVVKPRTPLFHPMTVMVKCIKKVF